MVSNAIIIQTKTNKKVCKIEWIWKVKHWKERPKQIGKTSQFILAQCNENSEACCDVQFGDVSKGGVRVISPPTGSDLDGQDQMSISEGQFRWNNRVKVIRLRRFGYLQRVGLTGEHDRDTEIVVVGFKREQHKEKTLWDNLLFTLNFK